MLQPVQMAMCSGIHLQMETSIALPSLANRYQGVGRSNYIATKHQIPSCWHKYYLPALSMGTRTMQSARDGKNAMRPVSRLELPSESQSRSHQTRTATSCLRSKAAWGVIVPEARTSSKRGVPEMLQNMLVAHRVLPRLEAYHFTLCKSQMCSFVYHERAAECTS